MLLFASNCLFKFFYFKSKFLKVNIIHTNTYSKSFKKHFSHFIIADLLIITQSVCYFLSIKKSHCWHICDFGKLVFSQKMFRIFPGWPVTNKKYIKWKAMGFALLFESGVKMLNIITIWAPVGAIFSRLTCEKNYAFGLFCRELIESLLNLCGRYFIHWEICCRKLFGYFI